jgi:Mrp family chromosome partitioning ATPase
MQTVADAEVVAGAAEASLLVIREHQTPVPAILEALDSLRDSNAKPICCVLNDSYGDIGASLGGYQYGSDYGYRYGKGYGKYYGRYYGHYGDRTGNSRKNGESASRRSRRSEGTQEGTSGN